MAKKHIITSLALCALAGCSAEPGTTLYMTYSSGNTYERAVFNHAGDCELLAEAIQEKEPAVRWFCK